MLRLGQLEALERAAGRNCYCEALLNGECMMKVVFLELTGH